MCFFPLNVCFCCKRPFAFTVFSKFFHPAHSQSFSCSGKFILLCPLVKFSYLSSLFCCKYNSFLLAHYQLFSRCICYLFSLSLSKMNSPFLSAFSLASSLSLVLHLFPRLILTIQLSVMLSGFRLYLPGVRKRPIQLPCTQNLPGPSVFFPRERTRQEIEMLNRSRNRERK